MLGYSGWQERTANDGTWTRTQQICTDKARYESHNVMRTAKRYTHSHTHTLSLSSFPGTMTQSVVAGRCRQAVTHKPPRCGKATAITLRVEAASPRDGCIDVLNRSEELALLRYYGGLKNLYQRNVAAKHCRLANLVAYSPSSDIPKEISGEESVDTLLDVRIAFVISDSLWNIPSEIWIPHWLCE